MRRAILLTLALVLAGPAQARDYGQQGTVFPVIERDLLHVRPTERGFDFLSDLQALFLADD